MKMEKVFTYSQIKEAMMQSAQSLPHEFQDRDIEVRLFIEYICLGMLAQTMVNLGVNAPEDKYV